MRKCSFIASIIAVPQHKAMPIRKAFNNFVKIFQVFKNERMKMKNKKEKKEIENNEGKLAWDALY